MNIAHLVVLYMTVGILCVIASRRIIFDKWVDIFSVILSIFVVLARPAIFTIRVVQCLSRGDL